MPFYPIPLFMAIIIWVAIFYSTGAKMMISGLIVISLGLIAYFVSSKMKWIGGESDSTEEEEKA
jgi:hypothetical protein